MSEAPAEGGWFGSLVVMLSLGAGDSKTTVVLMVVPTVSPVVDGGKGNTSAGAVQGRREAKEKGGSLAERGEWR